MATRRVKRNHNKKTRRVGGKKSKTGKKWTSAIDAAQKTLQETGSLESAKKSLRKQALYNARKLFGSI